jgi:hypothetical protein
MVAPVPIMVRGKLYPSLSAAARALGVTRQSMCQASKTGISDKAGTRRYGGKAERIIVDGVLYKSWNEAKRLTGRTRKDLKAVAKPFPPKRRLTATPPADRVPR